MSTQEKFPELSSFLRPLGFVHTYERQLRFLACLDCQIERKGVATAAEAYGNGCIPRGSAGAASINLEKRGIITRERGEPNGIAGRPPFSITFDIEISEEFRNALRPYRPCEQGITPPTEQLPDDPATQEHLVVINNSRLAGSGRSDLVG